MESSASLEIAKHTLLLFGIVLGLGTFSGLLARLVRVPDVVVFLLAGMLIGPGVLDFVDIALSDVGRVGGLTEAMRVCHMAQDRGRLIVPHCWKTGIGIAAAVASIAGPNAEQVNRIASAPQSWT